MDEVNKDPEQKPAEYIPTKNREAGKGGSDQKGEEETQEPSEEVNEEPKSQAEREYEFQQRMINLQRELTTSVTNIQIAADVREVLQRIEREEALKARTEMIENNIKSCMEKFPRVFSNDTMIDQEIKETLKKQQECCAAIIEEKKILISVLQQELKVKDDCYVKDLKKFSEELDLMSERMEEQIRSLIQTYRNELAQRERSYQDETEKAIIKDKTEWVEHMEAIWEKDQESMMERRIKVKEYEENIRTQKMEHYNIYIAKQIESNKRVQDMERELQCVRGNKKMMQLKGLKKRYDANILSARQDRIEKKVIRNMMRAKNLSEKHNYYQDFTKKTCELSEQYKRCIQRYERGQKQLKHSADKDVAKFKELWLMMEADLKQLVEKVLTIDSRIHRHLGLTWNRPLMPFMERSGPIQPQKQSSSTVKQLSPTQMDLQCSQAMMESSETEANSTVVESMETLKEVMELLCDETGFLMEDELLKQLAPLERDRQAGVKLGSLLCSLGIEEEDVPKLADFLLKYKQRQTEGDDADFKDMAETSRLIHPNHVLPALKGFLHQYRRSSLSQSTSLEDRDNSEDAAYWESFANVISVEKLGLWDVAESKLKQYHAVLKEISELLPKTEHLKQQNAELRSQLQQITCPQEP